MICLQPNTEDCEAILIVGMTDAKSGDTWPVTDKQFGSTSLGSQVASAEALYQEGP